jgi:hypothetical protein
LRARAASAKDESTAPAAPASASARAAAGCARAATPTSGTTPAEISLACKATGALTAVGARSELAGGRIEFSEADGLLPIVQLPAVEARRVGTAVDRNGVRLRRLDRKPRREQPRHIAGVFGRRDIQRGGGDGVGLHIEGLKTLTRDAWLASTTAAALGRLGG